jgi:hypothetical protein
MASSYFDSNIASIHYPGEPGTNKNNKILMQLAGIPGKIEVSMYIIMAGSIKYHANIAGKIVVQGISPPPVSSPFGFQFLYVFLVASFFFIETFVPVDMLPFQHQ